jgi:hypothetical protein
MKDAVVRIGGCTGVVISRKRTGSDQPSLCVRLNSVAQQRSNDYLTDGFWAMSGGEACESRTDCYIPCQDGRCY